ncbi:MAG TPA: hypothetical protein VJQ82_27250 [Terriglobales bacterium]|nr:hypothetical protein [Terriglobales bacterium]
MPDLLNIPAVRDWANSAIRRRSGKAFGNLVPAVVWTDRRGEDGNLLVPIDPAEYVALSNAKQIIVLHGHDPGKPKGQVLESAYFESDAGEKFIVAILGFYAGGEVLGFKDLHLDTKVFPSSPKTLPALPNDLWIELATDPREIDASRLEQIASDAPLAIKFIQLSHNSAEPAQELIRVGVLFMTLAWNPFVKTIATEAGKDTYAAIHKWVKKLVEKLADQRNPVLDIHAFHHDCQVSFLIRGKDIKVNYAAHETLSRAAVQAAQLVENLKARGMAAQQLVYEFDRAALLWFPSFAVLTDNRIITDTANLIAIENLPTGISMGMTRGRSSSPALKSTRDDDDSH